MAPSVTMEVVWMMRTMLNRGASERIPSCTAALLVKMPPPTRTKLPAGGTVMSQSYVTLLLPRQQ